MKRLVLLSLVSVLAACGGTADPAERAADPVSASLVRAAAAPAPGVRAADGSATFLVRGRELLRFDAATREQTGRYPLRGRWTLGGVSATGRWIGLTRAGTEVIVVDAATGKVAHELRLPGRFAVETISKDGDFLFLQQSFVDGSYAVRGYDLVRGQLLPGSLGTKGRTVRMQGRAGQVVASPDGEWLLTLYVDTKSHTAFVHALNLVDRTPICILLPPCEDCADDDLTRWTLRLRPDGRTLLATHPDLGRAVVDLPSGKVVG